MADDTPPLLIRTRKESRNVLKCQKGDVECVAEPNKSCCFVTRIDVQTACENLGLIGNNADGVSRKMTKTTNNVHCIICLNFQKASIIEDFANNVGNVVWFVCILRNDGIQSLTHPFGRIGGFPYRSTVHVVRGKHIAQISSQLNCSIIAVCSEMRDTGFRSVGHRTPQVFERDNLVCNGLDHLWTCDEHVCGFVNHDDKIGNCRTVDCSTCTRAHDDADLGYNARSSNVPEKDFSIRSQ